ncbi:hypothetical protein BY996DRAFT_8385793 [Phakopsora pachyrhizi]|nr:hypothetical protein BY996DRAFT_8385793 [Phakopsora pachyrhizi]
MTGGRLSNLLQRAHLNKNQSHWSEQNQGLGRLRDLNHHQQSHPEITINTNPTYPTEPTDLSTAEDDFCNSFWGEGGFETLMSKLKCSGKMLEELRAWYKERSNIESDYSKRLLRLSRSSVLSTPPTSPTATNSQNQNQLASAQTGTAGTNCLEGDGLRSGLEVIRCCTERSALYHAQLSNTFKNALYEKFNQFIKDRESTKRNSQAIIEKLRKNLIDLRVIHEKSRRRFEADAIAINGYSAQLHLAQGRDSDKVSNRLEKVQMSININDKEYKNHTKNLQDTTNEWNTQWKNFCDLVQDLEEDRIEFVRNTFWDYANGISAICVAEDEQCEKIRLALERCEVENDVKSFVRRAKTGNEYSLAPGYVDYSVGETPNRLVLLGANFIRTSARKAQDTTILPMNRPIKELVRSIEASLPVGSDNFTEEKNGGGGRRRLMENNKRYIKSGGVISESVMRNSLEPLARVADCSATYYQRRETRSANSYNNLLTDENLSNLQLHLDESQHRNNPQAMNEIATNDQPLMIPHDEPTRVEIPFQTPPPPQQQPLQPQPQHHQQQQHNCFNQAGSHESSEYVKSLLDRPLPKPPTTT